MLYYMFKLHRWWNGGTEWLEDGHLTESTFIFKKNGRMYKISLVALHYEN